MKVSRRIVVQITEDEANSPGFDLWEVLEKAGVDSEGPVYEITDTSITHLLSTKDHFTYVQDKTTIYNLVKKGFNRAGATPEKVVTTYHSNSGEVVGKEG